MAYLPQTRDTIIKLRASGFKRHEYSVTSPPSMILQRIRHRNGIPIVSFKDGTEARQIELAPELATQMKVVLYASGGDLHRIQARPWECRNGGLYLWFDHQEILVESMEIAYQLAQWRHEQLMQREAAHEAFLQDLRLRRFNFQDYMEPDEMQ